MHGYGKALKLYSEEKKFNGNSEVGILAHTIANYEESCLEGHDASENYHAWLLRIWNLVEIFTVSFKEKKVDPLILF